MHVTIIYETACERSVQLSIGNNNGLYLLVIIITMNNGYCTYYMHTAKERMAKACDELHTKGLIYDVCLCED